MNAAKNWYSTWRICDLKAELKKRGASLNGPATAGRNFYSNRKYKFAGRDDDDKRAVDNKLRLIQIVGEARGRRALAAWPSRTALVLRARDHAAALLSGVTAPTRDHAPHRPVKDTGLAALPSGERLSPLDTFLDLLTAKASLNELDFNLIIEATLASVQQETNA